jgi:hypothetical protein
MNLLRHQLAKPRTIKYMSKFKNNNGARTLLPTIAILEKLVEIFSLHKEMLLHRLMQLYRLLICFAVSFRVWHCEAINREFKRWFDDTCELTRSSMCAFIYRWNHGRTLVIFCHSVLHKSILSFVLFLIFKFVSQISILYKTVPYILSMKIKQE